MFKVLGPFVCYFYQCKINPLKILKNNKKCHKNQIPQKCHVSEYAHDMFMFGTPGDKVVRINFVLGRHCGVSQCKTSSLFVKFVKLHEQHPVDLIP